MDGTTMRFIGNTGSAKYDSCDLSRPVGTIIFLARRGRVRDDISVQRICSSLHEADPGIPRRPYIPWRGKGILSCWYLITSHGAFVMNMPCYFFFSVQQKRLSTVFVVFFSAVCTVHTEREAVRPILPIKSPGFFLYLLFSF